MGLAIEKIIGPVKKTANSLLARQCSPGDHPDFAHRWFQSRFDRNQTRLRTEDRGRQQSDAARPLSAMSRCVITLLALNATVPPRLASHWKACTFASDPEA